jgi:hypothetical protein
MAASESDNHKNHLFPKAFLCAVSDILSGEEATELLYYRSRLIGYELNAGARQDRLEHVRTTPAAPAG